jgi:regulatory protein
MSDYREKLKMDVLAKMQGLCSRAEKSSGEIRCKLQASELGELEQEWVINRLREDKFIDDDRFAKAFVRDKFGLNGWGRNKIRQALHYKGIDDARILKALEFIDEADYRSYLKKELSKKSASLKESNPYRKKAALFRFAAQKGFESGLIYELIGGDDE